MADSTAQAVLLLLLEHVFGQGYRRVQWHLDALDAWRRTLAAKNCWTLEGVLRKHMVVKDMNRDSALYSVTNSEWPCMQAHLAKKVHGPPPKPGKGEGKGKGKKEKANGQGSESESGGRGGSGGGSGGGGGGGGGGSGTKNKKQ
jgi:uncharacterized membrane protein YgcG